MYNFICFKYRLFERHFSIFFYPCNKLHHNIFVLIRISLRGDRFALSSQIILIVFIILLINSEMYESTWK